VNAANYDIVIFCDDDNLLAENYIQYAYELICKTKKAGYGIWGGKTIACFDEDAIVPDWFEKEKTNYVVGKQAASSGDISNRGYVWGAGMVILKDAFLKATGKNVPLLLTGRKGGFLSAGDDSEICARSLILGYKLYYDENLILQHYIAPNKLTKSYNEKLVAGFKAAKPVLNKYQTFIHYVSGRSTPARMYYSFIYRLKWLLNKIHIRKLTPYDESVIKVTFASRRLKDDDFILMENILKIKP
jgi:hypothetical protein